MKNWICFFVFITLFATVWQVQASDWGSRLEAEQAWLVETLTPEPEVMEQAELLEDSISTGQAAPKRSLEVQTELENPWDLRKSEGQSFRPSRKRSR